MKKYGLLLLTLTFLFAFSISGISRSKTVRNAKDEEYKIYSTILKEKYSANEKKPIVIIKTTDAQKLMLLDSTIQGFSASLQKALKDYNTRTNSEKKLLNKFNVKASVTLVDKKDIDAIFEQGVSGWDTFYKKFPDSGGHIRFSNIIMNAEKNQALVFVQHLCGGRCASGKSYVLVKQNDAWKIDKEDLLWIS
jgi:hypothetical protein